MNIIQVNVSPSANDMHRKFLCYLRTFIAYESTRQHLGRGGEEGRSLEHDHDEKRRKFKQKP
jgi:hypothetical protein